MYCELFCDVDKKTKRRLKKIDRIEEEFLKVSVLEGQLKERLYSLIVPLYIDDRGQLTERFDAIEWPKKIVHDSDFYNVDRDLDALLIWAREVSPGQVERIRAANRRFKRFVDKHYPGEPFDVIWPHTI